MVWMGCWQPDVLLWCGGSSAMFSMHLVENVMALVLYMEYSFMGLVRTMWTYAEEQFYSSFYAIGCGLSYRKPSAYFSPHASLTLALWSLKSFSLFVTEML